MKLTTKTNIENKTKRVSKSVSRTKKRKVIKPYKINDDSKIINLLLESNPQLKNVSPARAEKILRNRFPDYFE